jgi:hypothetical protein
MPDMVQSVANIPASRTLKLAQFQAKFPQPVARCGSVLIGRSTWQLQDTESSAPAHDKASTHTGWGHAVC